MADIDADHDNWIRVLDDLSQWDLKTVVPGHGSPGSTETLHAQRQYLANIVDRVRTGVRDGKTAEELIREVDLTGHGSFGANAKSNADAIRAIYRKLTQRGA